MTERRAARDDRPMYVFALCEPKSRVPLAIGTHRLESFDLGGVVAIVERRSSSPVLSERSLRDQFRVVVELHRRTSALLPVRFGALLDRSELDRIVKRRRSLLVRALKRVRGTAQMTIRSFGVEVRRRPESRATTGTAYLSQRARAARPIVPPRVEAVRKALRSLAAGETIEPGRGGVRIVIHHLIRATDVDRYLARAKRVVAATATGEPVIVSGPLPPFAFAPDIMDSPS